MNILQAFRNGQITDFKKYKQLAAQASIQEYFTNIFNYTPTPSRTISFKRKKIESKPIRQKTEPIDKPNDDVLVYKRQIMLTNYQHNVERYLNYNRDLSHLVSILLYTKNKYIERFVYRLSNKTLFSERTVAVCRTNSFYDDKCRRSYTIAS